MSDTEPATEPTDAADGGHAPSEPSGPAPAEDRAALAGFPPDSGPEVPVLKLNEAMFRARPLLFVGMVALGVVAVAAAIWFAWIKEAAWVWAAWGCLAVLAADVVWLLVWKVKTMTRRLEITNKRTVRQVGLFSRDSSEVLHDNIRNFTVRQSLWERLWSVGEIGIASSGQDDVEITMARVPNPREVQRIIDLYRPLG